MMKYFGKHNMREGSYFPIGLHWGRIGTTEIYFILYINTRIRRVKASFDFGRGELCSRAFLIIFVAWEKNYKYIRTRWFEKHWRQI